MLKEARFVQTSRKKLSDLFFNHIKVAKLFAKGKKPICVWHNNDYFNGDASSFGDEKVKKILNLGSHFVPYGSGKNVLEDVRQSIKQVLLEYFLGFMGVDRLDRVRFEYLEIEQILYCLGYSNEDLEYISYCLEKRVFRVNYQKHKSYIDEKTMDYIRTTLDGYVLGPTDKNSNKFFIMWPVVFFNALNKMYIHNIDNYKVVENDIEKVIKDLTNRANNILSRIDKNKRNKFKNKNGQIQYGYVIPKDKDKNKYRPVVSYYNHKYKKTTKYC